MLRDFIIHKRNGTNKKLKVSHVPYTRRHTHTHTHTHTYTHTHIHTHKHTHTEARAHARRAHT